MLEFDKLPFKIDEVHITSDTHGYHKNITRGVSTWGRDNETRDFANEELMTQNLIQAINKQVKVSDLLIHAGDWTFGGKDKILKFREQIHCQNIILLQGNHDHHVKKVWNENPHIFTDFSQIGYYRVEGLKFVISHFPMAIWHQSHKDIPHFYGHVHGSFKNKGKSLDVGVDHYYKIHGKYGVFTLREAYNRAMNNATFLESHHGPNTN